MQIACKGLPCFLVTRILTPAEFHPILKNKKQYFFQKNLIAKTTREM